MYNVCDIYGYKAFVLYVFVYLYSRIHTTEPDPLNGSTKVYEH